MYVLRDVFIPCVNFEFVLVGQDGLRGLYAGISPNLGKPNSVNETSSSKRFCHHKTISFNVIAMHCRTFLWAINAWTIKKKRISRSVSFYLRWKPNAKEKRKEEEWKKTKLFPFSFILSLLVFDLIIFFHFSFFLSLWVFTSGHHCSWCGVRLGILLPLLQLWQVVSTGWWPKAPAFSRCPPRHCFHGRRRNF